MNKRKIEILEELILIKEDIVLEEGDPHLVGCRCQECIQEILERESLRREVKEDSDVEAAEFCEYCSGPCRALPEQELF